jgi:glycosyltransferase involved in cell wall biosynthesis
MTATTTMTGTIDCRWIAASGVGVYLRGVLTFFLKGPHRFLLLGDQKEIEKYSDINDGINNTVKIITVPVKPFSVRETYFFPQSIVRLINQTDWYFSPYFNIPAGITIPVYTTIHDIIFPDMPELTSKTGLKVRMWFYKRAFRLSKKIFTVSRFSAARINHYAHGTVPVITTYSAPQEFFLEPAVPITKKKQIVFVGNIKKHKGLKNLVEAYLAVKQKGVPHKLIIVGEKNNFRSQDNETAALLSKLDNPDIICTGFISNDEVKRLLAESALLVQPSLYEGFCCPPLEAMLQGTPALISDIPVLREVYSGETAGFPVTFFKAGDSSDLADKLFEVLSHDKGGQRNITLTREQRNKYTFEKTAAIIFTTMGVERK